MEQDGLFEHR